MNRCRGTLRMRSRIRRSAIPCSCRRSTSRSRVRADVMPMPLRRGPSMKLVKIKPPLEVGQGCMASQIDLQRSYGREPFSNGVKIRAGPGVLPGARVANPVYVAAARVLRPDDGLGAMPAAQPSYPYAAQLSVRQVRHIDIEYHRPLLRTTQGVLRHSPHQLRSNLCGQAKIARAVRRQAQRYGDGRQAEKAAFDGGRDRARVQGIVAEIGAVIDAGHDDVVFKIEQSRDRQMYAIGRRAVDVVGVRVIARGAHRYIESQRIARPAAVSVGRNYGDGPQGFDRPPECRQALGPIAVVI